MDSKTWGVLWDVDGTLVDTAELHYQAWVALATEIGKTYSRQQFADTFGWRNPEIIPLVFGSHYTESEIADLGRRKEDYYRAEATKGLDLLPGVGPLVQAFAEAGIRQVICSSAPRANIEMILEMTRTRSHFEGIVAMEDVARGKPNPDVFLKGASILGLNANRCLVFEDAPVGIQAAKAGGMTAVGVTFVGHHSAEKLKLAGADLVVTSLTEIDVAQARSLLANV